MVYRNIDDGGGAGWRGDGVVLYCISKRFLCSNGQDSNIQIGILSNLCLKNIQNIQKFIDLANLLQKIREFVELTQQTAAARGSVGIGGGGGGEFLDLQCKHL